MKNKESIIDQTMKKALEQGVFPGAVLLIGVKDRIVFQEAYGYSSLIPEKRETLPDTLFDLSSLTKPLATTTAVMLLLKKNLLSLSDPLSRFIPEAEINPEKKEITLFHLLNHSSGLAAWKPFYRQLSLPPSPENKREVYRLIHRQRTNYKCGAKSLYSDLGFILLGELVERLTQMSLDSFCAKEIFNKLELQDTCFINLPRKNLSNSLNIAATEESSWRKGIICGEVHDDNAYIMGGVAGHAGLFSTASDIYKFVRVIFASLKGENDFLPAQIVKQMLNRQRTPLSNWGLGWDTPDQYNSTAGRFFAKNSFGHLGYTGTSLWVDPEQGLIVILLSNRVHPSSKNNRIKNFRPRLHDLIYQQFNYD